MARGERHREYSRRNELTHFLSLFEESQEPSAFMRVVRRGRVWSLEGDTALFSQLGVDPSEDFKWFNEGLNRWERAYASTRFTLQTWGVPMFLKVASVVHTPYFPVLRARMYEPEAPIPHECTLRQYFAL